MTAKEALEIILDFVNLDEYDYETKGIGDAERLLKQALTELEAIKSADGGEAIKILQKLATIPLNIDDNHWTTLSTQDDYKSLENYLLKSQAQDQELQELKLTNAIAVTNIRSVLKDCRISKIKRYCIDDELKEICPTIYKNDGDAILETIKNFAKEVKSDE